jgi:hypothetical protein
MLGKLTKVDLRNGWKHEAIDFTNWLAQEENLDLLAEEVGFDIKLLQTEARVGSFNVDILAEEENTDNKIIIENQLETTNHDHLGKIITYASGYDAKTIIWVVKDAREEHRSAVEWLNENTTEEIGIYLVKIELWQIGESPLAPKFEVLAKPNNWARTVKEAASSGEVTERNLRQLEFWEGFKTYAKQHNTTLRLQKALPQHWTNITVGSSEYKIALLVKFRDGTVGCELYIHEDKNIFKELESQKLAIESELGMSLSWRELPDRKASRILIEKPVGNFDDEKDMEAAYEWLKNTAEKFKYIFPKYLS